MNKPFTFGGRIGSVEHAVRGIVAMVKSQPNARIHAAATIMVSLLGLTCGFARWEWCWIVSAVAAVWAAEAFNSDLELLADVSSSHHQPMIGTAKDMAAGAVLICAIGSVVIGLLMIGPYIVTFFEKHWESP